jgi:hypothetical protein
MPIRNVPNSSQKYYLLNFDAQGTERPESDQSMLSQKLLSDLGSQPVTDVFLMSHGWRGDVPAAIRQYDAWSGSMMGQSADIAQMTAAHPGFQPLLVGLHWPSEPWGDEQGEGSFAVDPAAIEKAVDDWAGRLGDTPEVRKELNTIIRAYATDDEPASLPAEVVESYRRLNAALKLGSQGVGSAPGSDRPPFDPEDVYQAARQEDTETASFGLLDTVLGTVLAPLRTLSFYLMKDRARIFGESGAHSLLLAIRKAKPGVRIHLMGHSFGCVVMSAATAGPAGSAAQPGLVYSLVLVQGALSLWSYADSIPVEAGTQGYFRRIIAEHLVAGPIVTTQSEFDNAVGRFYPIAAGLRQQVAFGDFPKYGGVGSFGIQGLPESIASGRSLGSATEAYQFQPGKIYNLEGSGIIKQMWGMQGAHSDIVHPEVAHAIWAAAL